MRLGHGKDRCPSVYAGKGQCDGRVGHAGPHCTGDNGEQVTFTTEEALASVRAADERAALLLDLERWLTEQVRVALAPSDEGVEVTVLQRHRAPKRTELTLAIKMRGCTLETLARKVARDA